MHLLCIANAQNRVSMIIEINLVFLGDPSIIGSFLLTRVSKWGLETRKSPSPSPKFGEKVKMGRGFLESLGKIRGLGEINF